MTNDKQLLLAALAAGLKVHETASSDLGLCVMADGKHVTWNPRVSSADAFALAVARDMDLNLSGDTVSVCFQTPNDTSEFPDVMARHAGGDKLQATRDLITAAAAAYGERLLAQAAHADTARIFKQLATGAPA